ncbi:MAG: hypothetical protein ACI31R_01995 [Bacilli bacterium]
MSKPIVLEGDKFLIKLYNDIFLDKINVDNISLKKDKKGVISCLKNYYFDKCVISSGDIPKDYLNSKKRVCVNRGLSFSKGGEINRLRKYQEKSLEKWFDFLISDENDYPMWVRYWIFKSVLDLGYYDCDKHVFNSRTDKTIFPFAKLDFDALDSSVKSVMVYYGNEDIDDDMACDALKQVNFGKIYSRFLWNNENIFDNDLSLKDGIWVKYGQGSDYKKVLNAINDKFTSWSFDDESLAKDYINVSDIYIYFTKDYSGNFTMPRIAIVTEQDKVVEVRGIADDNQNVEFQMLEVVGNKLRDLSHNVKYDLMLDDIRQVYKILNKENSGEILTREDLAFMYECDRSINFFGTGKDYEVLKFLSRRNAKEDYSVIYGCSSDLVGFDSFDLEKDLCVFVGDIKNYSKKLPRDFKCPSVVIGNFEIPSLISSEGLESLTVVKGDFVANSMVDASCFSNLEVIGGNLVIGNLKFDFPSLNYVGGKRYKKETKKVKKLVLDKV